MRADVAQYITCHNRETLNDLKRLVRQPSVSAQALGTKECAALVKTMMEEAGLTARLLDSGHDHAPVVYGEKKGRSDRTLLFYNHYDVQPADPLGEWDSK